MGGANKKDECKQCRRTLTLRSRSLMLCKACFNKKVGAGNIPAPVGRGKSYAGETAGDVGAKNFSPTQKQSLPNPDTREIKTRTLILPIAGRDAELLRRIEEQADRERRSPEQQALYVLERAVGADDVGAKNFSPLREE